MSVKWYRKKSVEIEAIQWLGNNYKEVSDFVGNKLVYDATNSSLFIPTLEGTMHASINDFIIKGIQGEFYPCKPNIFWDTYDLVENND